MITLTDGFLKMMNFNNVFRWHWPFLFLVLLTFRAAAADTLLILGDSLSAGYRMSASAAWPALLNDKWQTKTPVVNASISGDTSQQGLARLPALLKQHQPRWVLVELGGNDGLRGFALTFLAGILCVAFAASDEFHQTMVANRGPSVKDVGIDSIGVLFGITFVRLFCWIALGGNTKKRKRRRRRYYY